MTFGANLQQFTSHRALLHLQDAEIHLLELIKKCLNQRVKSDRDYANSLSAIITHSQKMDSSCGNLPMFQVWNSIVKETEGLIVLLRDHAEKMSSRAVEQLNHIITEKRTARKFYNDEKTRLDQEFNRIKEDVNKIRAEYEKAVNKQVQDRVKYEELIAKGIVGKRIDDARSKLTKSTVKLHKLHNDYVAILQEATLHQQYYMDSTLPGLLDYQEEVQKGLLAQCQSVLVQYSDLSNLSTPDHKKHFDVICDTVATLSPESEYQQFVEDNKSEPLPALVFAFDKDLLQPYKGCLQPNELSLDTLTYEFVNHSHSKLKDQVSEIQQKLDSKRTSLVLQKEQLSKLKADKDGLDELQKHSYSIHTRAVLDLEREIQEVQCKLSVQQDLETLYKSELQNLGDKDPPPALDFQDSSVFSQARNYEREKTDNKKKELPPTPPAVESSDDADIMRNHRRKQLPAIPKGRSSAKKSQLEVPEVDNKKDDGKELPSIPKPPDKPDDTEDVSDSSGPSAQSDGVGRNLANSIQGKVTNLLSKMKKTSQGSPAAPPKLPAKDFREDTSYIQTNMPANRISSPQDDMDKGQSPLGNNHPVPRSPSFMDGYQQLVLDPNRKLDEEEWFHGVLPREEVQRLLTTDGDYLVRESKNRRNGETTYVLSVFWTDHKHFIIQGQDNCWRFEGEQYSTVQELIINQHNSGVSVTRKSGAILKRPILRETWELRNDDIILGQKIGNGNFGDVFKGTYKKNSQEVAIKTCKETLSEEMKKKFLQEGRILKQYEHKNIVSFIGIAAQRHPVMIVMEFVPGGALLSFLRKHGANQTKRQLVKMCDDASAGMAYLEERNCIHRDLAARNCLVGKNNIVKISDFGMSREEEEYTVSGGLKQIPIKWTAPEALNFGTYTSACDVWSFGVLTWEVFSFGQSPYPGLTNSQARERVDEGYRMPMPEGTPTPVYDLMLKMWEQEAKNRPHFDEIQRELEKIYKSLPVR